MLRAVYMCHTQFARQVKNKHKSAGMFVKTQSTKYAHHLAAPCLLRHAVRRVASSPLRANAVCCTFTWYAVLYASVMCFTRPSGRYEFLSIVTNSKAAPISLTLVEVLPRSADEKIAVSPVPT